MVWSEVFSNILQSVSILIAALSFAFGVNAWRREFVGKRRIELAEEVLALFYEAKDIISFIRSPFSSGEEGKTRVAEEGELPPEKEIKDRAFIVFERFQKHQELFNRLHAMRYRFMAQFGSEGGQPFDDLRKIVNEIFVSANMLQHYWLQQGRRQWQNEQEFQDHLDKMHKHEAVFWEGASDNDPINPRMQEVITAIESRCRKIIGEAYADGRFGMLGRVFSRKSKNKS
jgi:hypothetical protein